MIDRCGEIDELLAAFAVDAVPLEERLGVFEHLAECRLHDEALAGFRAVADLLALDVEPVQPPQRLRAAMLDQITAADGASATEAALAGPPARQRRWRSLFLRPAFAYGLAATLFVLAAGLGAWNVPLQSKDEGAFVTRELQEGDLMIRVLYSPRDGIAVFSVDLPALEPDKAYQAWSIEASEVVSIGLLPSEGTVEFAADLSETTAIAVSIEPAGGSVVATTDPILVADF